KGLTYAQKICSTCHNVLKTDAPSPNKQAPPFKEIANIAGMSVTALTVWSRTTHPTMPNFVIAPEDMDDLIAYILSLRDYHCRRTDRDVPPTPVAIMEHRGDPATLGATVQRFIAWRKAAGMHPNTSPTFNVWRSERRPASPAD